MVAPNAPSRSGRGGRDRQSKFYELPDNLDIAVRPDSIEIAPVLAADHEETRGPGSTTPPHLLAELGERPSTPVDRVVWETAADAISQYRDRYAIPNDDPRPLGPKPTPGRFGHRHDHAQVIDYLTTAARRLDHTPPEPDTTPAADADRERLARDRDLGTGYEP